GESDLYYAVFGLDALAALRQPFDQSRVRAYAELFGHGDTLDFVHLCALARCWSALQSGVSDERRDALTRRLATFRSRDGGFNATAGSARGTAYGAFLGVAAHQDLKAPLPEPMELVRSLKLLE